jgi:PAS domain S-box-containing protein
MSVKNIKKTSKQGFGEIKEDLEDLKKYIQDFTLFLPLAFSLVSPFHMIVSINQAFKSLVGYDEIEVTGRDVSFLFLEKAKLEDFKKDIIETGKKISKELTLITKDRNKIPVNVIALARKNEEGDFQGYFLTISDISESKKFREELERQVTERTKELQKKIEELEKINRLTVGRELKMIELKKEIERLKEPKDNLGPERI